MIIENTKPYHSHDKFTLYHGDSLKLLKKIPDNSIDMIFADPPYHLSNGGITVKNGKIASVNKANWDKSKGADIDFMFHHQWITETKRILKPHGTLWVSGTYHSIYHCGASIVANGMKVLNEIAWLKPNAPPNISCRYFTASHETLIWAAKDHKTKHTFNYPDMREGDWPEDSLKKPGKQMRSVWSIPFPGKKEKLHGKHPTQKPINLLKRIVAASTEVGDLILDPFTGSSTTGIAACNAGRQFIGLDSNKEYLDLSRKRLLTVEKVTI